MADSKEIKVSVIMLTYNHEAYVRRAMESVLAQETAFAFELLIGDDASGDATPELIGELARGRENVFPVLRERNLGATNNLYDLQRRARGEYLAYLDGDDFWCDTHKLQKQVDLLDSDRTVIACTHRCRLVNEAGEPLGKQHLHWLSEKEEYSLADFHGIVLPGHFSSLVHRNFFAADGDRWRELITMHPVIADRSLSLLLATMGKIRQLPEVMGCYRVADKPKDSATDRLYRLNRDHVADDYEYTKELERYARETLGVDAGFGDHVCELFVSAAVQAVKAPSGEHFALLRRILRENDAARCWAKAPAVAVQKIKEKL